MPTPIRIVIDGQPFPAELNDTATSKKIAASLPIDGAANLWGDEIYFSIPVSVDDDAPQRAEFEVGELGFWPPGSAFCIFFGPTPASVGDEPRMANPGTPLGFLLEEDLEPLREIADGTPIRMELA